MYNRSEGDIDLVVRSLEIVHPVARSVVSAYLRDLELAKTEEEVQLADIKLYYRANEIEMRALRRRIQEKRRQPLKDGEEGVHFRNSHLLRDD